MYFSSCIIFPLLKNTTLKFYNLVPEHFSKTVKSKKYFDVQDFQMHDDTSAKILLSLPY